ncbi:hypothetical protein T484DRAFT_2838368 [Baffinella frigidus]|nr:hypothetical protein T484DRAFT_2838368 [Cryptophyta sp. CCMP2293]
MADEEEDAAAPEIHMASQVRSADLGDSFEAVLAREIADALNISKSQVLLTSFESQSSTVFYKIVQDKTGYGRTNAEVYADAMYQLQEKNSKLRQCNIAGHVTSITLAGKKMAPNVVSVGASSHAMQSMKKGQLVASLQGAQHKVLEQEHCLSVLQAKYSSVMMNVGLDITVEAPHYVRSVHDFMDERGFLQGEEEYCNKMVERDDILVAVDDNDVADADMMQIRQWLRGPPYTVVSLTLKRDLVLIGEDGETLEENDEEMQELTYKVQPTQRSSKGF